MEILTLAGSQYCFQTKFFKFCCNSPPKWIYSTWRVDMNFWVSDDHSPWWVMKLAMASCPEFWKNYSFSLKWTGFIMLNPKGSDSDPNTTQRWTESQLLQKFRIFVTKTLFFFWKFWKCGFNHGSNTRFLLWFVLWFCP